MASVITTTRPHNTHIVVSTSDDDDDGRSSPYPPPISTSLSSRYPHINSYLLQLVSLYAPTTAGSLSDEELSPTKGEREPRLMASLLLPKVIALLREDSEDDLKELLKDRLEIPDDLIEPTILELMHKHLNDQQQVPFTAVFASTPKRPSRPSSRASTHSFRLESNSPASSPRAISFIHASSARRPHTPVASSPLHINATAMTFSSPASSPPILHAAVSGLAKSSPTSSPLSSPRFLNAKEFKPRPSDMHPLTRTLSTDHGSSLTLTRTLSTSSDQGRGTPSPDLWAHNPGAPTLTRTSSNLAIAAPLVIPSRSSTPGANTTSFSLLTGSRPSSRLGAPSQPPFEDEDDDEFSPFGKRINVQPTSTAAPAANKTTSEGEGSLSSTSADAPSNMNSIAMSGKFGTEDEHDLYSYPYPEHLLGGMEDQDAAANRAAYLGGDLMDGREGMTPFDVLQSVFGNTLAPGELEDALGRNGWDFEGTMQYLVDRQAQGSQRSDGVLPTPPPSQSPHSAGGFYNAGPGRGVPGSYGHKVMVVPREQIGFMRGGRPGPGFHGGPVAGLPHRQQAQFGGPGVRGGRVCRYFLAGECRRADCRFSHDLDRALCRFWLRGICAKGDQCEFLHRLPNGMQLEGGAIPGAPGFRDGPGGYLQPGLGGNGTYGSGPNSRYASRSGSPTPPALHDNEEEEFPALGSSRPPARLGHQPPHQPPFTVDPSKNRFARQGLADGPQHSLSPPIPNTNPNGRPSPRILLRPPSQLPLAALVSLPVTENLGSKTYQTYRERPQQLSAARNACLARAADAWRRGDVQLAKRFTREGHELNAKMRGEGREGGRKVVLEWVEAFREELLMLDKDGKTSKALNAPNGDGAGWDRGEVCANGLGVCLGHAPGADVEMYLDLRGLYVDEGIEMLEEYLMVLERDGFIGLAYAAIGEDPSTKDGQPNRLAGAVKDWLGRWAYPWMESDASVAKPNAGGLLCIDALTHAQ